MRLKYTQVQRIEVINGIVYYITIDGKHFVADQTKLF